MRRRFRLEPPLAERPLVTRDRLLDRLRSRWTTPVTVVSAPAGYGKTTLLVQALADNEAAPRGVDCWLTCAPDDESASSLADGLRRALTAADPVDPTHTPAQQVTEAMWRRSPTQVCLFVDDVQHVPPGSPAADLLAGVVDDLPANGHLVLAGRGPPPVPLARLEVAGRLVRLGEDDLSFTPAETAAFAAARAVPSARLDGCGGWPALAELSATAAPDVTAAYIGQEVLAGLPPDRRRTLGLLAHVDPVDDELAGAVLGAPVDLDELLTGVPLVARAPGGERSLHGLWRSLLAREVTDADIAGARCRAARVARGRGQAAVTARLLIDARAWDQLGDVVVEALGAAHPPVARDVLAGWYQHLPVAARDRPSGRLLAGVVAAEADPDRAGCDLDAAAEGFRAAGDAPGELACLVQTGLLAWWAEDRGRLAAAAARVFELEAGGCADAVPLACLGRAVVFDVQNEPRAVLAELDRIPRGSLNDLWRRVVSWLRSSSFLHLGEPQNARAAADDAPGPAGERALPLLDGVRLQARWFQGDVDAVAAEMPALADRAFAAGLRNYAAVTAAQCALVDALSGRAAPATEHLARARAAAGATGTPLVDSHLSLASVAVAVATGDEDDAASTLDRYLQRQPLATGHSAAPQQRCLALIYVLAPGTRPAWEAAVPGPAFATARDLARAVAGVRDDGRLPAGAPALPAAGIVRAHLPRSWAVELAVAAVAAGRDDGWDLLDALWPDARPDVARVAEHRTGDLRTGARAALARLAVPPAGRLELRLLGATELRRDGAPVAAPDWRRERVRSLLAHLALHGTVSRGQVGNDLWPALDAEAQSRNLRVTLSYLLRVLEPDRPPRGASFFVRQDGNHLVLHPGDRLGVDVWTFDALAGGAREADGRGAPSAALDQALAAVELCRGEPAELAGEPWAVPLVERWRLSFAGLATRAGELLLARGAVDGALALAERALAVDPWREEAHRLVVAAHRLAGDDLAARRALGRFRSAIDDLGITPGEATLMVERLLDAAGPIAPRS